MLRRRFIAALTALPWLAGSARAQMLDPFAGITSVEVFCNSAMLIEPVAAPLFRQTIYRMDALDQALEGINRRIPRGSEQEARAWIAAHLQEIKRQATPPALAAANAINLARYYRIDRLPAIVINRAGVVYGVTQVAEAIMRYQAHARGSN